MRIDELRVDAEPRAGAAQASREDERGVELLADRRRRDALVAIRDYGRARKDPQPLDLRQLRDDVLGHSIAEVFVLFDPAGILEVENSDRFAGSLPSRVARLGRATAA